MFFDDDICFCGNADDCPLKEKCKRARKAGAGIHTYSLFYNANDDKCEFFYPEREER